MGRTAELLMDAITEEAFHRMEWEAGSYADHLSFRVEPKPIPCDPTEEEPCPDAWALFVPEVLARVIERNLTWLQWTPRTSSEALEALFVNVTPSGMSRQDRLSRISDALFDAGFIPSDRTLNPTWTFPV